MPVNSIGGKYLTQKSASEPELALGHCHMPVLLLTARNAHKQGQTLKSVWDTTLAMGLSSLWKHLVNSFWKAHTFLKLSKTAPGGCFVPRPHRGMESTAVLQLETQRPSPLCSRVTHKKRESKKASSHFVAIAACWSI